jgi:protein-S-isoprenylcysteine O-methyltransferase Ste14
MVVASMSTEPQKGVPPPAPRQSLWLAIPPPVWLMGTLVAGLRLNRRWPKRLYPAAAHSLFLMVGYLAMAAAAGLVVGGVAFLVRRRTTLAPGGRAAALIVAGPYRLSRNPMYLGLTLLYLGITVATGVAWPLLLLPLPLWIIDQRIIPFEEQTLEAIFGDVYRAYQRRVRRWI